MGIIKIGAGKYLVDVTRKVKRHNKSIYFRKRKTVKGTIAEAKIVEGNLLSELKSPVHRSLKYKKFGQCLEEYLVVKGGCWDEFRKKVLMEELGDVSISNFSQIFSSWLELKKKQTTRRGKPPANASGNRFLQLAKAALSYCVTHRFIESNPLLGIQKERESVRIRHIWEHEWSKIYDALPGWLKPICRFAYLIPTRKGELEKALGTDIDFVNREIHFRAETTKTGVARHVPIPESMLNYFLSIPDDVPWLFYREYSKGKFRPLGDFHKSWDRATRKAGVTDVRFHDLRGTAASNMYAKGVDLGVVCDIGGWKNPSTFLKHYNMVFPEKRREAVRLVDCLSMQKTA